MTNTNIKFNHSEKQIMNEIKRRIKEFKNGDKNQPMIFLGYPSEVKSLVNKNILTPYRGEETPKILNWYNLTETGKQYF